MFLMSTPKTKSTENVILGTVEDQRLGNATNLPANLYFPEIV